jgi:hypothetical protein
MNNIMPSRLSVLMNQNQNNIPEGRNDSNIIEKKPDNSYKSELATTQNVDSGKNAPSSAVSPEPKKEPSVEINVIKDYDWTYSKNKIRKLSEIPYIKVKEFKLIGNTYISSLMTTALLYPDIIESNVGQNSFFEKINSSFSNNSFAKFMGDSVSKVTTAVNNTAQKTANWVTEQMKSIDDTANSWGDEQLIKNYSYLYLRRATGTTYRFPYYNNDYIAINNQFNDTYSGSEKDTSRLQKVLDIANEKATAAGQYLNIASVTEPGMYVQRPKFYNFDDKGETFLADFVLFNTITENAYLKNLELITKLLIQNTPHRHNRLLVDPPCIYELTVPGRVFYPYACIEEFTVKHVGTKRMLKNAQGKDVPVPDAYQLQIKFRSLTMEVNNFIIPQMGSAGINVSKRSEASSSFKGTPPDTTEVSRAAAETESNPKTEAEQTAKKQEEDSGSKNEIVPRSTEPDNRSDADVIKEAKERHNRNQELRQSDGFVNEYQRNRAAGMGESSADADLIKEAKERHSRNQELRQSDGFANEYQRNRAAGRSNSGITGIED